MKIPRSKTIRFWIVYRSADGLELKVKIDKPVMQEMLYRICTYSPMVCSLTSDTVPLGLSASRRPYRIYDILTETSGKYVDRIFVYREVQ